MLLSREVERNLLKLQETMNKYYTEKVGVDYENILLKQAFLAYFI